MKYYHRTIEKELEKMLGAFPAIMILGPRQSGKSTLLSYLAREKSLNFDAVTLDDVMLAAKANEDPAQFIESYRRPLVIDEFQYAKNLTSYIKIEIDQARNSALFDDAGEVGTLFYLTGSQVFDTKDAIRETLAGRVGILNLYPLSTRELESAPEKAFSPNYELLKSRTPTKHLSEQSFYKRILRGSYPELYNKPSLDTSQFYSSYLQTYIERDIRRQIRPENEYNFTRFISLLAARTGQQLVIENLARDLAVDSKTISGWLSLLESSGLVHLLRPYYTNSTKRISKKPKIYFTDTGLACYLAGYPTVEGLMNSAYKGQIFETYVVTEILKSLVNSGIDPSRSLYFYRTSTGSESDLLMKSGDTFYPIEIKSTASPSIGDTIWFKELKKLNIPLGNGLVICRTSTRLPLSENNYAISVEYI